MSEIQPLGPEHADAVMPLVIEAGWNQVAADWRFMLSSGHGIGVRDADDRWIGTGLVLPFGNGIAWISMVLVAGVQRRQGLGGALLSHCFARAESQGYVTGLDATELGRPVYLRHGFRDLYPLRRWRIDQVHRTEPIGHGSWRISRPAPADLPALARYDLQRSGLARGPILGHLLERRPDLALIATRADGSLAGYALARDGRLATHIGPVVADEADTAIALIDTIMTSGAPPFMIDVPRSHARLESWLEAQGGFSPRAFMRMLRGSGSSLETPGQLFALAGPELA